MSCHRQMTWRRRRDCSQHLPEEPLPRLETCAVRYSPQLSRGRRGEECERAVKIATEEGDVGDFFLGVCWM